MKAISHGASSCRKYRERKRLMNKTKKRTLKGLKSLEKITEFNERNTERRIHSCSKTKKKKQTSRKIAQKKRIFSNSIFCFKQNQEQNTQNFKLFER